MLETRTVKTKVGAGGKIEVSAPDLPAGETVEVTVRVTNGEEPERQSILDILDQCRGSVLFKTAEEVEITL